MSSKGSKRTISSGSRERSAQPIGRGRKGDDVRRELLALLVQHCYQHADYPKFKLASGVSSDTYIDCKATTCLPEAGRLIGEICADLVPPDAEAIGGLTMGADAVAYATSAYFLYVKGRRLNCFVVRKTPKDHGLNLFIEGTPGKRVVVVDDVVTTGGSTIQAIERCRDEGIEVVAVIVLVDREECDGLQAVQRAAGEDVPVQAIFKKSELLRHSSSPNRRSMAVQLPRDIKRLRAECVARFGSKPTIEAVIGEILRCIDEEVWVDEQGVPAKTVDLLDAEISPALDAVFRAATDAQLSAAVDHLVVIWRRIKPFIELA